MDRHIENQYTPDHVSHPGATLIDVLNALGMSQAGLAERTGLTKKTINEIAKGKAALTPTTALKLERVLGTPASFWNNRERHYREFLARAAEQEQLRESVAWLKSVPLRAMIRSKWIRRLEDPVQQMQEVLGFFGVASPQQWRELWLAPAASFRKSPSFQSEPGAVAAWLRKGEIDAQGIQCANYDDGLFRRALDEIRGYTLMPPEEFSPKLIGRCAACGVAVVFVPELPRTRASGATRWLSGKAIVQVSLRYRTDDHLWFSFFHEAGHILRHGRKDVFIEDGALNAKEEEANEFARTTLIPDAQYRRFVDRKTFGTASCLRFAQTVGIAPGIVVGRLQHDHYLLYSQGNALKRRLRWTSP